MKTILVTGLDGSGKSTFFSTLEKLASRDTGLLQVPYIDTHKIPMGTDLFTHACMVNALNDDATEKNSPLLKAISFFSAMILFNALHKNIATQNVSRIFCERHPVIDSSIYGIFYAEKCNPVNIPSETLAYLNCYYTALLEYILMLLPGGGQTQSDPATAVFQFIFDCFHLQENLSVNQLETMFKVQIPEKIFYLSAPVAVLFERIRDRTEKEPHEQLQVLEKLHDCYTSLLRKIKDAGLAEVVFIDATDFSALDRFTELQIKGQ